VCAQLVAAQTVIYLACILMHDPGAVPFFISGFFVQNTLLRIVTMFRFPTAQRLLYVGGADKSLAVAICSTTKIIFPGWDKEVRTTKS
jgi:hypothetical protein